MNENEANWRTDPRRVPRYRVPLRKCTVVRYRIYQKSHDIELLAQYRTSHLKSV